MFTIKTVVYPKKIEERLARLQHTPIKIERNASATTANFTCGSFVRFSLAVDARLRSIVDVLYASNGCGFMLATADVLAGSYKNKLLADLHGLTYADLIGQIQGELGDIPPDRVKCIGACIFALRAAFADHRTRQIEEFRGEKALICTCFGVTEETIERTIQDKSLRTVDEVASVCNAGSGCGSCRMLIQELLDMH